MKKSLYTLCFMTILTSVAFSQDFINETPLSEQEPYQQLIGYALEVGGATFEAEKNIGKYKCSNIYSAEGYDAEPISTCEVIVHADTGPIVVRYKDIDEDTSAKISTFLVENHLTENVRYSNGRFRFSFEKQEEDSEKQ